MMNRPTMRFKSSIPLLRHASRSSELVQNRLFSLSVYDARFERHRSDRVSYPGRCRNLEKFRENLKPAKAISLPKTTVSQVDGKQMRFRIVLSCCLNQVCHSKEDVKLDYQIHVHPRMPQRAD
jgi:hypothetical protein